VSKRGRDYQGRVWFIEVKRPKGRYTAAQVIWRGKWQGPEPITVRSVEDVVSFVREATR
jgi:hypothetical protein